MHNLQMHTHTRAHTHAVLTVNFLVNVGKPDEPSVALTRWYRCGCHKVGYYSVYPTQLPWLRGFSAKFFYRPDALPVAQSINQSIIKTNLAYTHCVTSGLQKRKTLKSY